MADFEYKVKDAAGHDIKGVVEARDEKQALAILREKKYFSYFLRQKSKGLLSAIFQKTFHRISIGEIATFTRQLATMVSAGLPLTGALIILKSQRKTQINEIAASILKDVEGGSSLSSSLKKFPRIFSGVYVALVEAGESAGVLDNVLSRLADNLEAQKEFRSKIKGAMLYPMIIILGMGAVIFVMMIFVIPKLTSLYQEFNAKLPGPTVVLLALSKFMVSFWWLVLLAIGGLIYLFNMIRRSKAGRRRTDGIIIRLPIIGKLQKEVILAEFTRTLGLLIGAGVSLIEALEISAKTANNVVIKEGIVSACERVEKGFPLSSVLAESPVFPSILAQMLSVGEETGKVDEVLLKVAKYFQTESEETLKSLTTAMEPLIMILLGLGVGFLIIAIILPIYSLTSQFQ